MMLAATSRLWRREWTGWPLAVILCLHSLAAVAAGQDAGQGTSSGGGGQSTPATDIAAVDSGQNQNEGSGFGGPGSGGFSGALPSIFKKHLISSFSASQVYERGIWNGSHSDSKDTYTEAAASFLYDLERKHSEYTFDYHASARHYNRFSGLDTVSHQAGFGQVVHWSPRLSTVLRYRISLTPDYSGDLLQESISRELSLASPSPVPEPLTIPAEQGLVTLRSNRMTHNADVNLSYLAGRNTMFSVGGSAERRRYQDGNLFGSEHASIAVQVQRTLSPRTSVAIAYQGSGFRQPGGLDRTIVQAGSLSLQRQFTPHLTIRLTAGRWWSHSTGREVIPLSPVLSDLLGTPALIRDNSLSFSSWTGSANLLTHWQWRKVDFGFTYDRGITNNNLLSRPADTQSFGLSLGRQFGKSAFLSGNAVYQQHEFFTLRDADRIDQGVLRVIFSRKLFAGLDFSMFANYSKLLQEAKRSFLFDHAQGGIRFTYHLPRVRPS